MLLKTYVIKGKIIDKDNKAAQGLTVRAYDFDSPFKVDDFLGEVITNSEGLFHIKFDTHDFKKKLEIFEKDPSVYLIVEYDLGEKKLQTKPKTIGKEIEYRIKLGENIPDPAAPDIYSDFATRTLNSLRDVGGTMTKENTINLDVLAHGNLAEEVKKRLENFERGFIERSNNFNSLLAALDGLISDYQEYEHLGNIGYDGPQVPRLPRRESYHQVIIWPRKEDFKWA